MVGLECACHAIFLFHVLLFSVLDANEVKSDGTWEEMAAIIDTIKQYIGGYCFPAPSEFVEIFGKVSSHLHFCILSTSFHFKKCTTTLFIFISVL